jgi:hypothetical protein
MAGLRGPAGRAGPWPGPAVEADREIVRVRQAERGGRARPPANLEGLEGAILEMSESSDGGRSYAEFPPDREHE